MSAAPSAFPNAELGQRAADLGQLRLVDLAVELRQALPPSPEWYPEGNSA